MEKPPKGKARTARRERIAAGIVQGKTISQVASEEGISRNWAAREASAPETAQIITALCDRHRPQLERLFQRSLDVLEEAMAAKATGVTKDGVVYEFDVDHYARLTAVSRYIKLITAGRAAPRPVDADAANKPPSWDEFLKLYKGAAA